METMQTLTFEKIKSYYDKGYWTGEMVYDAYLSEVITGDECKEIIGDIV